jgi:murein hydrolase activator
MCRWLSSLFLLLGSALGCAQPAPDPAELERLNGVIAKVQAELASTRSERSAIQDEVLASERSIQVLQQQREQLETAVQTQRLQLEDLQDRQAQAEQKRQQQQQLLGAYLKSAWIAGDEEYLKLLLNQQDPLRSARMLRYYAYVSSARSARLESLRQTLVELQVLGAGILATAEELEQQQAALDEQTATLSARQAERQQALASLDSLLAARGEELRQLEMEKVEIEILLEELRRSITEIPVGTDQEPFIARKGSMAWPLEGRLLNSFGARHALGDLTWEGVRIAAPAGADVRALHHGRVVFADWFNTSGLLLIIDHGDGYMSLYAHNQELYKAVGDWVASAEVIAAVGDTGGQREQALYFEIRRNGKAENPVNWCVAR